jgi:cell division protein FtsL
MRWKTKKLIMWIIVLVGIIMLRECKHVQREYNLRQEIRRLETIIDKQIEANNWEIEQW